MASAAFARYPSGAGSLSKAGFWRHVLLIALALPTALFLLLSLVGVTPKAAARAIGTVAIIVLLPVIVRLYPAPITNGFYTDILRQPWLPAERSP